MDADVKAIDMQVGGNHYKDMKIQPITYVMANQIPFPEGNIIKYVSRWRKKNGIQDLKKAAHMLNVIIEAVEKENINEGPRRPRCLMSIR